MYRLLIKRPGERDLRRLPRSLFQLINRHILALRSEPRPSGVGKLKGAHEGWRIRVGDYRIVYQIDNSDQTETVVRVPHRRHVYAP